MGRPRGKLTKKRRDELRAKRKHEREQFKSFDNPDAVMTFDVWCRVNSFSHSTGKRVLGSGACRYVQLSEKRKGITVRDNREYQQSRSRGGE
jgi:hypothetical protein